MYPPHHRGGYELIWESAVDHLERRGHEVRVLTTIHREPGAPLDKDDERAHRDLRWYWHADAWPQRSPLERLSIERHNQHVLRQELFDFRPDVVCWWAMGGMSLSMIEAARKAGIPEAFVLCDDWLTYGPRVDGWIRAMQRLGPLARLVGAISGVPATLERTRSGPALYPSRWLQARAQRADWKFSDERVVGQGVPAALFSPAPLQEWKWRIVFVGRLDERKGVDLAIGALAHLPDDATLTIVGSDGDAEYRTELTRLVEQLDVCDRVEFTSMPRSELGAAYASADVVLFPVRWPEPWGLVPLEAMAVGRPVIASGRGGSSEYLLDGTNCLLADPDEGTSAIARSILALADDPTLRRRLRDGGFETARSYPEDGFDHAVEALISRAVEDA